MLLAQGLYKRFGSNLALNGFDLQVEAGEIAGLVGHNGAGKSTFAWVAAGVLRADQGTVAIAGINVQQAPRRAREKLGLAPQELALYPTATVLENLQLFGSLAGLGHRHLAREIEQVVIAFDIKGLLGRRVQLLSGGQQRRVQAATALLHRPAVLILDEPTAGADPLSREALLLSVRQRAAEGAAICYTTHYLAELDVLQASVAVASSGRVIARGTREQLLAPLPGELWLKFEGPIPKQLRDNSPDRAAEGDVLRVRTKSPSQTLAELLRELGPDADRVGRIEVRPPTLDDLYRHLLGDGAHAF